MTPTQQAMALRMINASICTYQIHPNGWIPGSDPHPPFLTTVQSLNGPYFYDVCPTYQDAVGFTGTAASGFVPDFTSDGVDDIDAALVGMMSDGNLLIAIRGTIPPSFDNDDIGAWIDDWTEDGEITPRIWSPHQQPHNNVMKVQTGFAKAMMKLWLRLGPMVAGALNANPQCTGICITGHSKGAAMTLLCADLIAIGYPKFLGNIQVHAFATPASVNLGFVKAYTALGIATHRYQVENDLVPFLPLWTDADVFTMPPGVSFDWPFDVFWRDLGRYINDKTDGGYDTCGDFTYFAGRVEVPGVTPGGEPKTAVLTTLAAGDFGTVADAHSATDSYLPCFQ